MSTGDCTAAPYIHPHHPADGHTVCQIDADRFRQHCVDIPDLWAPFTTLGALLPRRGETGRTAPGAHSTAPIDLTVAAMHDPRTSWAEPGDLLNPALALGQVVVRVMAEGTGKTVTAAEYTVADSCRILGASRLTRWALAQDWAGLMCWTVKLVRDQLAMLGGEHRPRPVGACINPECDGWVWPTATGARCGRCGVSFQGMDLVRLRLTQEAS